LLDVQFAAWADAAKPRKAAKRKDKLSKAIAVFETFYAACANFKTENQRKTMLSARRRRLPPVDRTKTWLSQLRGGLPSA